MMACLTRSRRCLRILSKSLLVPVVKRSNKSCISQPRTNACRFPSSLHTSAVNHPRHSAPHNPPPPEQSHSSEPDTDDIPSKPPASSSSQTDNQPHKSTTSDYGLFTNLKPNETTAMLFPGQGSQFVGMGERLLQVPGVIDMYREASGILGYDLLEICLNGPSEKLDQTVHCQPAIFVTSLAAIQALKHRSPWAIEHCVCTAGFSIGEYAALVFAGAMSFQDAVHVIKERAEAMENLSRETPSGMMTVYITHKTKINFACHVAKRYCQQDLDMEKPVCEVANFLFPECKVIAGHNEALDFLEKNRREFGIPRTQRLPVSGAFHTNIMSPAVKILRETLKDIKIYKPIIPVYSNITGKRHSSRPNMIKQSLAEQVCSPVKWEQIVHRMYSRPVGTDFPFTYELGPGTQLGSILRRVNLKAHELYEALPV